MPNRLTTRVGLPSQDARATDALDVVAFREASTGATARTKGQLFLLAQVDGRGRHLRRAAERALADIEAEYYYDLSAGVLVSLSRALRSANRRLYHERRRLGIPQRASIGAVAAVVRDRQLHVARLGPGAVVLVRDDRMYELPFRPPADDVAPGREQRRVAASLGEALEVQPFTWEGELAGDDRLALLSRNLARVVGVDELRAALASMSPGEAARHLRHLFARAEGRGSDGLLVVEVVELEPTATTRRLEPVRPAEPLAGLPDQSPVPLADALGAAGQRIGTALGALRSGVGRAFLHLMSWMLAFVPRRRPSYPRAVVPTSEVEEGRRRRVGLAGMVAVAVFLAAGISVYSVGGPRPTDAIPRAAVARAAISEATALIEQLDRADRDGADMVARDPAAAERLLEEAGAALLRARGAGIGQEALAALQARVDRGLDALYRVTRLGDIATVARLDEELEGVVPERSVAASDGTLWLTENGRGRILRVDPASGGVEVVARAGQALDGGVLAEPWLIATAATDVVVVDRERQAWRFDLAERIGRRMPLAGIEAASPRSTLLGALQHRPPLEIFTLYLVDGESGQVAKWTPPPVIPVTFPDSPEAFLTSEPDLPARAARDLRVDANLWLLQRSTVTRVNFGSPLPQLDYSLDRPPDEEAREPLDYRLLNGATVGERELFYVYDAANERILAFARADGAFLRQWRAPRSGPEAEVLGDVVGLSVTSVADGPPSAFLVTAERVVRVVLE